MKEIIIIHSFEMSLLPDQSIEWFNELRELHYVPYNSCNSLTIYSYKYWFNENRFLVATKANNLKEFSFKNVLFNDDTSSSSDDLVYLSNISSVSSNNSQSNTAKTTTTNELTYLEPFVKLHQFSKIKSIISIYKLFR